VDVVYDAATGFLFRPEVMARARARVRARVRVRASG